MAFCPECGKAMAADATRCVYCGHEIENKAGAAGGRFKGTMMMATSPVAKASPAQAAPAQAAPAQAVPVEPAKAAAPAAAAAQAPAKSAAKATMIGTGLGPIVAKPAAPATAQAERTPAAPAPDSKRNMAFAQTQHGAMFVPQAKPAAPESEPESIAIAATPLAPRPEPEPEPMPAAQPRYDAADDASYAAASDEQRPVLRYNDSLPELPRHNPLQDKKLLWIAAGVIGVLCLGLLLVLASKLTH